MTQQRFGGTASAQGRITVRREPGADADLMVALPVATANAAPRRTVSPSEAAATAPLAIWNSQLLGELIGDNPGAQQRLLQRFLAHAQQQREAITRAAAGGDFSTLLTQAHTLKSAARSVGAMALGQLCQQLETASTTRDLIRCQHLAQALPGTLAQAQARIDVHLAVMDATPRHPHPHEPVSASPDGDNAHSAKPLT